jgi:hypothetical protein
MRLLGCTEEEALDIIECDKKIDRGEKVPFDITKEQEKETKKYRNAGVRKTPTVYDFSKRERKENTTKSSIITQIHEFLTAIEVENLEIINKEREISFKIGENSFSLTLTQHRNKKKEG